MNNLAAPDSRDVATLAARYGPAISAYFSRRVADRDTVEDLTQEVFVSLLRRANLEQIENIEGYIFRVAANILKYRVRLARRRPDVQTEGGADPTLRLIDELSPERIAIGHEAWQNFVQSLQELPERARNIFILNRFEGLSGREIALHLGVSVSLVEKDMIKAMTHLRKWPG